MPDAPTLIKPRRQQSAMPVLATDSPVLRWLLRSGTALLFVLATWVGVQLALDAPREPPTFTQGIQR